MKIPVQPVSPESQEQLHGRRSLGNKNHVFVLLLILIGSLAWLPRLKGIIDLRWDSGVYYVLGTSLANGKGYRLLNEPGEIEAVQYPPLLPAIIGVHQVVLGTDNPVLVGPWLRRSWCLFFLAFVLSSYYLAKIYLPQRYAFFAAIISSFSLYTLYVSDMATPEVLYAACSALFFVLYNRHQGKTPVLAVLAAASCYFLRTIGIALLAAWVLEVLFQRKIRNAFIRLFLSLILISPWIIYIKSVELGGQYSHPAYEYQRADYLFYNVSYIKNISLKDPFAPRLGKASVRDWFNRWTANLQNIPMNIAESLIVDQHSWYRYFNKWLMRFPIAIPWSVIYLSVVSLGWLIIIGIVLQLRRRQWLFSLYVLLYVFGICLAPWPSHMTRYLVPLIPFLVISLMLLVQRFKKLLEKFFGQRFGVLSFLILFAVVISQQLTVFNLYRRHLDPVVFEAANGQRVLSRWFYYDPAQEAWDDGLRWFRLHGKPGNLVACSMPHSVYLHTGFKAVMTPIVENASEAQRLLDSVPAHYLILDNTQVEISQKYAAPVVKAFPELWEKAYSSPTGDLEIYERVKR